jgi:hypothetical protein
MKRLAAVLVSAALFGAPAAFAHHAFSAEFDANQPITLRGTVTKMEGINPHSWLYVDVKGPDGSVTNWAVEAGAPNAMFRRGWNKNSIPVGIEVVVDGYRAKNGKNIANGRDVTLPDGKKLFVGSSGTGAPADGRDASETPKPKR